MRIVVNGWFADQLGTGSGQYLAGLAAWLPSTGASHDFVLARPAGLSRETGDAVLPGWDVVDLPLSLAFAGRNLAKLWFEQVTFPRACSALRADVALVPYWGSPWWCPCPVVVTVHDLIPLLLPAYRGGPLQRAYTWLVARTARRAAAILTDSEASRRDIIRRLHIAANCVHAVHLAADARFRPEVDPLRLAAVRSRYGLPESAFLLYLGGFDVRKNVTALLEAYARFALHDAAAPRLVIAGKVPETGGDFAPDPRPLAVRLGIQELVHFTGWVDEADKPALYSLAAAALFLSEYEGFGLPVLEAQACGCPVIAAGKLSLPADL